MTFLCGNCQQLERKLRAMTFERNMAQAAVALLNSMILCGEEHSDVSREAVRAALRGAAQAPRASHDR